MRDKVIVRAFAPQYDSASHVIGYASAVTVAPGIVVRDVTLTQPHPRPESCFRVVVQFVSAYNAVLMLGVLTTSLDEDSIATCLAATACALVVVDVVVCYRKPRFSLISIHIAGMDAVSCHVPGIEPVVMYLTVIYGVITNLSSCGTFYRYTGAETFYLQILYHHIVITVIVNPAYDTWICAVCSYTVTGSCASY